MELVYTDQKDTITTRVIWPLLIAYLNSDRYIVGWCETREGFRHFKTDRVLGMEELNDKYPGRRAALIKGWEEATSNSVQG